MKTQTQDNNARIEVISNTNNTRSTTMKLLPLENLNMNIDDYKKLMATWKKESNINKVKFDTYNMNGKDIKIKNKYECLDCIDHLIYTLIRGKDPLQMFAPSTIDKKNHIQYFKQINSKAVWENHMKNFYMVEVSEEFVEYMIQKIKEYIV
jgi:hypothetical protein